MKMKKAIKDFVEKSGLWSGEEEKYKFILSPDVYKIGKKQARELEEIGPALYDCLSGIGRIGAIAENPKIAHGKTWNMISRVLRVGIPKHYHGIQMRDPSKTPAICKVDLAETEDGYKIVEIDAHNKHGLGYSALAAGIKNLIMPENNFCYPSVVGAIAREIEKKNLGMEVAIICAEQEKFYLRELEIFSEEMKKYEIKIKVVPEKFLEIKNGSLAFKKMKALPKLLMDFPFLYHSPGINERMAQMYAEGEIDFLITPKPFLGSKSLMALLRNDENDSVLEAILLSQISKQSVDIMRKYIPETFLVANSNGGEKKNEFLKKIQNSKFVLKETVSCGMKGVIFSDEPDFPAEFSKAHKSYYQFILQKEIDSVPKKFNYYPARGNALCQDEWFMRVTAHYSARQVADVIVTARRDKKVHGATDCLQLGSIIDFESS